MPTARSRLARRRAYGVWLVALLLLGVAAVLPGRGDRGYETTHPVGLAPAAAAPSNGSATVNLTDAPAFSPGNLSVPPASSLSLTLVNVGDYPHTFTLARQPGVILNTSWSPSELTAYFHANGSIANVSVNPHTATTVNLTFNASTSGSKFEFVSLVPYQFQAGMRGFLSVASVPHGPPQVGQVNTTDQLRFTPSVVYVNTSTSGTPVTIDLQVVNLGSFAHTFTLSPFTNYTVGNSNYSAFFTAHAPLSNVNVGSGAGTSVWANFTILAPGIYEFLCEVQGHYPNGMSGLLYVGVLPPPPVATPSTALVQPVLLLGAGVLVGVGVVLIVAATYAGRIGRGN